jgi:pilus assembly protein Flp/PilA
MKNLNLKFRALHNDDRGQDLVEYALVTGIVSLGAVTALKSLATGTGAAVNNVATLLTNAITG